MIDNELKPVTITLSPLHIMDLLNIVNKFVPSKEARYTLNRLRVAIRASGYPSESELESAAGEEIRQRLKGLAEIMGKDEIRIVIEEDEQGDLND